jgi:hypothetical protein
MPYGAPLPHGRAIRLSLFAGILKKIVLPRSAPCLHAPRPTLACWTPLYRSAIVTLPEPSDVIKSVMIAFAHEALSVRVEVKTFTGGLSQQGVKLRAA